MARRHTCLLTSSSSAWTSFSVRKPRIWPSPSPSAWSPSALGPPPKPSQPAHVLPAGFGAEPAHARAQSSAGNQRRRPMSNASLLVHLPCDCHVIAMRLAMCATYEQGNWTGQSDKSLEADRRMWQLTRHAMRPEAGWTAMCMCVCGAHDCTWLSNCNRQPHRQAENPSPAGARTLLCLRALVLCMRKLAKVQDHVCR